MTTARLPRPRGYSIVGAWAFSTCLLLGNTFVAAADNTDAQRDDVAEVLVAEHDKAAKHGKEHGLKHLSFTYQYIHVDGFESSAGRLDIGETDTHTLNVEFEYALNQRWSVSAGIPLIRKRYQGNAPHNPRALDPVRDVDFLDDGEFHTNFQDFQFGIHYAMDPIGPLSLSPFIAYHLPSHDYAHFAHAAIGQNLWRLDFGMNMTYRPYFSDFQVYFSPSYVLMEKTLGTNINHWRVLTGAGYAFNDSLQARAFVFVKQGKGLEAPADFPLPRNGEDWYQHDRTVRHNYVTVGLGLDWAMHSNRTLSFSAFKMAHAEQSHVVDMAFSVGMDISF